VAAMRCGDGNPDRCRGSRGQVYQFPAACRSRVRPGRLTWLARVQPACAVQRPVPKPHPDLVHCPVQLRGRATSLLAMVLIRSEEVSLYGGGKLAPADPEETDPRARRCGQPVVEQAPRDAEQRIRGIARRLLRALPGERGEVALSDLELHCAGE